LARALRVSCAAFRVLSTAFVVVLVLLRAQAEGAEPDYPPVLPGRAIELPRDGGSHAEYRVEWWYVTGWLADTEHRARGFQLTFFRVRTGVGEDNPSAFAPRQLLFAHAAVADPEAGRLRHAQRSARQGFGLAYALDGAMYARIDDWSLRERNDGRIEASAAGDDFALRLELAPAQPVLLQGEAGYSRKGPAPLAASYYYSLPQLAVSGEVEIEGRASRVTGRAWLDHEWSSEKLDFEARGWDWTGINLDDGGALMAFRTRDAQGGARWAAATLRTAAGKTRTFAPDEVAWTPVREWRSPRTGIRYPVEWRLEIGGELYWLTPLIDDAQLDSRASTGTIYWEGPARLLDRERRPMGRGYLELTGYK
jgi:predicted secreted hydrolase